MNRGATWQTSRRTAKQIRIWLFFRDVEKYTHFGLEERTNARCESQQMVDLPFPGAMQRWAFLYEARQMLHLASSRDWLISTKCHASHQRSSSHRSASLIPLSADRALS